MIDLHDIRDLHLELTERCNAACPMCGRSQHGGKINPHLDGRELSLPDVQEWFPRRFIAQLESVRLCGNFGDPAVARECLEIASYFREANPALALTMNTNGSVRDMHWWFQLGRLFTGKYDAVLFALDGLADTHTVYRRNTSFDRIVENARAFMRGGGTAQWVYLVFEHNEHQVEAAEKLSVSLGFSRFITKKTKRFQKNESLEVVERWDVQGVAGDTLYSIRPPKERALRHANVSALVSPAERRTALDSGSIQCRAISRKSIFVSAEGLVFPCCWTAASMYPAHSKVPEGEILRLLGGCDERERLSLRHLSLPEILCDKFLKADLPSSWSRKLANEERPRVCSRICGTESSSFDAQFTKRQARRDTEES